MHGKTACRTLFSQVSIAFVVIFCFSVTIAQAQASRTWVSGVGDDANPCSRTAPCKTFAGAISKTAAGGEINALDPGGYGAVTITKSITIDGGGTMASILAAGTNGVVINAAAGDVVTLRNLSINGFGTGLNGIRHLAGGALHVENVNIFRFAQKGISFEPSGNASLFVRNCQISDNITAGTGGGLLIKPGAVANVSATIEDSKFDRNLFGVRAEDRAIVTIRRSVATGNNGNGFHLLTASQIAAMTLDSCVAVNNSNAGVQSSGSSSILWIANVTATGNILGLSATSGGLLLSFGNNQVAGNATDGAPTGPAPQV